MNGPDLVFAGAAMHTRMTVVRLRDGGLWIHSPIQLSASVHAQLSTISAQNGAQNGSGVAALIAPNKFHYLYLQEWRDAFPHASVFVEEDLSRKVSELSGVEILTNTAPDLYRADIDQVVFGGNRLFQEVVFFHKTTRTLIFTDLMINLKADDIKTIPKLFLKFEGVIHPNGGVPRLYRWFSSDRHKARQALQTITAWQPARILFCHGEPFEEDAATLLDREFGYLQRRSERRTER